MLHAAWTLLLARAPDTDAATAAALAIAVVAFAPFAALAWDVEAAAWPYALVPAGRRRVAGAIVVVAGITILALA